MASDVRRPLWVRRFATAATLTTTILGALLIRSERTILNLQQQARTPLVQSSREEFRSTRLRGRSGRLHQLIAGQEHYLLVAFVSDDPYATYRLEIVQEQGASSACLWSVSGKRPDDGAFDISVPGTLLPPGSYRLDLYETDGSRSRLSEQYPFTVVSAAGGAEGGEAR